MNNAIIYSRLSSPNQSMINNVHVSFENQLSSCHNYCRLNNLNVINEYQEIKSAKNMSNLKELIKIGENYSNINLVIYNITRFSRNNLQGLQFLNAFSEKNIIVHFVEENTKTNHHLDFHRIRLGLSQSEYESDTISNRIKSNNIILRNKGWVFGQAKYGSETYLYNGIRTKRCNKYERNIIDFIMSARVGSCSVSSLNKLLKKILPTNKVPIEFFDNKNQCLIEKFDKLFTLTFAEIADLLNSYGILCRNNKWSASSVNRIYNENANINISSMSI